MSSIGECSVPVFHLELVRDYSIPFEKVTLLENSVKVLHAMLDKSPVEQFVCLHVNSAGEMVGAERIAIGDMEMVHVGIANIFRGAILAGVPKIIVGHNHPSGSVEPSDQDLTLTGLIINASILINITMWDHVIVSPRGNHFSIIENQEAMLARLKLMQVKSLVDKMMKPLPTIPTNLPPVFSSKF